MLLGRRLQRREIGKRVLPGARPRRVLALVSHFLSRSAISAENKYSAGLGSGWNAYRWSVDVSSCGWLWCGGNRNWSWSFSTTLPVLIGARWNALRAITRFF